MKFSYLLVFNFNLQIQMLGKITTIKGNCPVSVANQHLVTFLSLL